MSSREKILAAVRSNQPAASPLPDISGFVQPQAADAERFITVLQSIGGKLVEVDGYAAIVQHVRQMVGDGARVITSIPELASVAETGWANADPHSLHDVQLAIFKAHLGVCENGAVWLNEYDLLQRAAAFIAENLAIVVEKKQLVNTMHDAYLQLGSQQYGYGAFIAGPSKTADIEQSLVLGAHGPRTMTVFLVNG